MTILVTGATGNVGRLVVNHLLAAGAKHVRALTNNPKKAALPAGVEVIEGFIGRIETLPAALVGVEQLYLAPLPKTVQEVVALAKAAGVQRIVDLSSSGADDEAAGDPSGWYFYAVEKAVEDSGIAWTHLRPGEFMTNMLDWADQIRSGVVRAAYGNAAYAPIDLEDIAAVATRALLEDGHTGKKYTLTGPETLSKIDRVRIIGEVLGREMRFEELTHEAARAMMIERGWSEQVADWLLDGDKLAVEHPQAPVQTVEAITGRPATRFAQWVARHAGEFR